MYNGHYIQVFQAQFRNLRNLEIAQHLCAILVAKFWPHTSGMALRLISGLLFPCRAGRYTSICGSQDSFAAFVFHMIIPEIVQLLWLCNLEIARWGCAISRLVRNFRIPRMCSAISRLHKFLNCMEHMWPDLRKPTTSRISVKVRY